MTHSLQLDHPPSSGIGAGGSRVERLAGQEEWVQSGMAFSSQNRLSCGLVLVGETALATPSMTSLKTAAPCLILPLVSRSSSHPLPSLCSN